ncbi:helix-turn-helix transcriptional regulator [Brevibacillus composti]|uniref:Helix-turn-helix transcriptional regulator n=1 Tax=Brevibacillus composti TaxID=2796470 RepID=A0ABX7Z952_9BACL|nr:helix-turn-helix transcriptional regulator [Brevibacillus composti]QUO43426.1 helix-turn-helix transcriptional regulator [Brevibacillus composti]
MRKRKLTPFGVFVKKRLIEVGKTQVELAREIGTSGKYLHLILIGERSGKTFLPKIAQALGIDPDKLEKIA